MALTESVTNGSIAAPRGPSPLLKLAGDDRLVSLTRKGNQAAYETLVSRYEPRLQAFCRNMLRSKEDAEDVLQEVFASAYNAMVADDRDLNVRPWLYRIARNRSLNHMRKQTAVGCDSMDVHLADYGASTADRVYEREEFRELLRDVGGLAEQQRTALLLREIENMTYEQIAEAMDTTVPAVKSLLVRARIGLADAAQSRRLDCDEVREDLGAWAEGLGKLSPPVRKHAKDCHRCSEFQSLLKRNNKSFAALFGLAPLLLIQKLLGLGQAAGATGAGAGAGASAGACAASSAGPSGLISVCGSVLTTKAAAGIATAAIVTGSAIEVQQVAKRTSEREISAVQTQTFTSATPATAITAVTPTARAARDTRLASAASATKSAKAPVKPVPAKAITPVAPFPAAPVVAPAATQTSASVGAPAASGIVPAAPIEEHFSSTTLTEPAPATTSTPAASAPNRDLAVSDAASTEVVEPPAAEVSEPAEAAEPNLPPAEPTAPPVDPSVITDTAPVDVAPEAPSAEPVAGDGAGLR